MMSNFTPLQQKIIDSRDKNLIVSASAGSGKTTVMIERIVKLIAEDKIPISKFLVVTFTKASSSDMKNKLIKKLSEVKPTPFILSQIDDIPISDISNLHSFCARLLKSYFFAVGIDPAFVVLDELEANSIKNRAMEALFREQYEQNAEFYDLVDCFSKKRNTDNFKKMILGLHALLASESKPEQWFLQGLNNYSDDYNKNKAIQFLNQTLIKTAKSLDLELDELIAKTDSYNVKNLTAYLVELQSRVKRIRADFDYIHNSDVINNFERLPAMPKAKVKEQEIFDAVEEFKEKYGKQMKFLKEKATRLDKQTLDEIMLATKKRVVNLYEITKRFDEIYGEMKKEKGGLDFNDLERFTVKVLENEEILNELKEKYQYIFVDEYQDINGMQEKIISLLSRENNRFMVGDVKQSIYRFRLCDPQIFIDTYKSYTLNSKTSEAIDLVDNFRSHKDILDFCNYVFSRSMTEKFGGEDYVKKQMKSGLGAWDNKYDGKNINLIYIDTSKEKEDKKTGNLKVYSVKDHEFDYAEEEKAAVAEAGVVARNIAKLMHDARIFDAKSGKYRKIEYSDIVILTASRFASLGDFVEVLRKYDLPVTADVVSDVYDDVFVSGVCDLLSLLSNIDDDEKLLSVLYSPLFGFNASDLALIRLQDKKTSFCKNIFSNAKFPAELQQKIQHFITIIDKLKKYAIYKPMPELLQIIEDELELETKIYASNTFEESLQKYNKFKSSLPSKLLNEYLQDDNDALPIETASGSNSIQVMTIHKSKGLEFPVVFLIGTGNKFNYKSLHGDCLYSKEFGACLSYFDTEKRYKCETPALLAAQISETSKLLEEQQRLLYVAMTRAINFLFVVGSKGRKQLHEEFENPTCFLDWFSEALVNNKLETLNVECFALNDIYENMPEPNEKQFLFSEPDMNVVQKLTDNFDKKYAFERSLKLPAKTSFSALSSLSNKTYETIKNVESNSKAIEIGNSYHRILQFLDFEKCKYEELKTQLLCLEKENKITKEDIDNVDLKTLEQLLKLSIFDEIKSGKGRVLRECEFYYNAVASDIAQSAGEDKILLQGIIDVLCIKDNCFDIIDYKTTRLSDSDLKEKYELQLKIYADAMEKALGLPLGRAIVVSIANISQIDVFQKNR